MLRRLYNSVLALAERPVAPYWLGAISFAESSFFPVPPDVMLVPMALARPERAWAYALVCTATSVAGGLLGYAIGALLFDTVGQWLFNLYGLQAKAEDFRAGYAHYGAFIILLKGVTPIPYKLVTITSGFAGYDLLAFTLLSIVTRGARFGLLAWAVRRYGETIRHTLDRHLGLAAAVLGVCVVGGFALLKLVG
ncbi:MAG: DedA family protein [Methylobacteriaceae bacterium]|nr:DedA family protein [Methylobacteriaceae bacterium]